MVIPFYASLNALQDFFDNSFVNETAFREVMAMKKADLLIIMFIQLLGDSLLRYLAVYSTNQKLLKEVMIVIYFFASYCGFMNVLC